MILTSAGWHIVGCSGGLSARNDDDRGARRLRGSRRGSRLSGGGRAGRDGDSHGFFVCGLRSVGY